MPCTSHEFPNEDIFYSSFCWPQAAFKISWNTIKIVAWLKNVHQLQVCKYLKCFSVHTHIYTDQLINIACNDKMLCYMI